MAAVLRVTAVLCFTALLMSPAQLSAKPNSKSQQTLAAKSEATAPYLGHWQGRLERAGSESAIDLSIEKVGQEGGGTFTMQGLGYVNSPILGSRILDDGRLRISLPLPLGALRIAVATNGDRLTGTLEEIAMVGGEFKELGVNGTAVLARAAAVPPAESKVPMSFQSDGAVIAGTLHLPPGSGPFAAAVYVHGSGDVDRSDATLLAERLNAKGVALLAYDKRGVGKSTGDWQKASLELLATDAHAALAAIAARNEIDARRIGFIGRSQGGWIVPIALREGGAAFAALISGPSVSTADEDIDHYAHVFREAGMTDAEWENAQQLLHLRHARMRGAASAKQLEVAASAVSNTRWFKLLDWESAAKNETLFDRAWIAYDPESDLQRLNIPTLWMFGTEDKVIPVEASVTRLLRLTMSEPPEIRVVAGGDHSLAVVDYPKLPTGVPNAFDAIADWIVTITKAR